MKGMCKKATKLREDQVMTITANGEFSVSDDYAVAERFISRKGDVIPTLVSKDGHYLVSVNAILKIIGYKNPASTIKYHFKTAELMFCKVAVTAGGRVTKQYFAPPHALTRHSSSDLRVLDECGLPYDVRKYLQTLD